MHEKFFKKRVETINEQENAMLKEYGWYVHFVFEANEGDLNGLANIHTHGLQGNFDHPDIQIVLPIPPETAHPVLTGIVNQIKAGEKFKAGETSSKVLDGMDVLFLPYEENGRTVLRLMLPDSQGVLPNLDECDEVYKRQMEMLPD